MNMADHSNELMLRLASHVKLFSGMPRNLLVRLLGRSERVSQPANGLFFDEGEPGESFFVLVMGQAVVEKRTPGGWLELTRLGPGEAFGEMTLLDDKIRSARVRALEPCVCLQFLGMRLQDAPDIQAVIFKNMARSLVRRLKATTNEMVKAAANPKSTAESASSQAEKVQPADDQALPQWRA
jgi:CRP-like cAMP-binding protein